MQGEAYCTPGSRELADAVLAQAAESTRTNRHE